MRITWGAYETQMAGSFSKNWGGARQPAFLASLQVVLMPLAWKPHFENYLKVTPFESIACPLCVPKSLECTSEWGSVMRTVRTVTLIYPEAILVWIMTRGWEGEWSWGRVLDWEKPDLSSVAHEAGVVKFCPESSERWVRELFLWLQMFFFNGSGPLPSAK